MQTTSTQQATSPRKSLMDQGHWAPLPSWVFESNHLIDPVQNKILLFIAWKNLSRPDPDYRFSSRYLAARTGLTKSTVHRYIKIMRLAGLLIERGRGKGGELLLEVPARSPFLRESPEAERIADQIPARPGTPGHTVSRQPGRVQESNSTISVPGKIGPVLTLARDISPLRSLRGKISPGSLEILEQGAHWTGDGWEFDDRVPDFLREICSRLL